MVITKLTKQRIDEIEAQTATIIQDIYGGVSNLTLPINLQKVLTEYGLSLKQANFPDETIAGVYDKNAKVIYVAANDFLPRQLFTIAHELGHFVLHNNKMEEIFKRTDALKIGTGVSKSLEEKEADWFAASILMPRELIVNYWQLIPDISQMANLFGVSQLAMRWRLINMGILRYDGI